MDFIKAIAAGAALLLGTPGLAQQSDSAPAAVDYRNEASWLCLPGRADACGRPLPTTALNANGYGSVGQAVPAKDPPADCFYVYPTVSRDPGLNSDLTPGIEENAAAAVQFARFAGVCRTYAPLYRQMTLASIPRGLAGENLAVPFDRAYQDVLAAFRDYMQNRNQGRPFVLVGHSQGSIHITRLITEEIEGKPAAKLMLSAIMGGWAVEVPEGQVVGGTFKRTPLCTKPGQTGCIVSFMSFRATNPPPAGSLLGRALRPGMTAACTNPAALGGGSAKLDSYWFTAAPPQPGVESIAWSSQGSPPTMFVRTEGLASAACAHRGQVGYLSVTTNSDPADARTDRIPGDVYIGGKIVPGWGLHLADMSLVQGDLMALVEAQTKAFGR